MEFEKEVLLASVYKDYRIVEHVVTEGIVQVFCNWFRPTNILIS